MHDSELTLDCEAHFTWLWGRRPD